MWVANDTLIGCDVEMFLPHRAWVGVLGWTGSPAGPGLTVRAGSVCGSAGEQKRTHEERNNKLRAHTSTRLLRSLPLSISRSIYPPGLSVHLKASSPPLTEGFKLCSHERANTFLSSRFLSSPHPPIKYWAHVHLRSHSSAHALPYRQKNTTFILRLILPFLMQKPWFVYSGVFDTHI